MVIKNVLAAVDGSENSDRALNFALDLAEKFNASLMILNVSEALAMGAVPESSLAYPGGNTSVLAKNLGRIHDEILSRSVARAKAVKPNLAVSSMLKEGEPALEIVNAVK